MNCSTVDLKAYVLGESNAQEKAANEGHIAACESCREELNLLQHMRSALLAVPDEPIPQRIAFVSDRVFKQRWWQSLWRSGPVMGFASALLIAGAILAHGALMRPVVIAGAPAPSVDTAAIERRIGEKVDQRIEKAVADVERRDTAKTAQLRSDLAAVQQATRFYQQQMGRMMVAYNTGGSR